MTRNWGGLSPRTRWRIRIIRICMCIVGITVCPGKALIANRGRSGYTKRQGVYSTDGGG